MPMPNRNVEGNYRYGYQGEFAEKEPELGNGQNSFQLRLYDARIGRWLTPDPMNEFFSPYLAMGNNPVYFIDPTGGITEGGGDCPPNCNFKDTPLDEVLIVASKPDSSGFMDFLNSAKNYAIKTGQHIMVIAVASGNAWATDQVLGAGRASSDMFDGTEFALSHRAGQIIGDLAAMVTGGAEIDAGVGLATGGVLATPATGGISLVGTTAGVGFVAHGTTVVLTGGWNVAAGINGLADQMSKGPHDTGGGGRKFKKPKKKLTGKEGAKDVPSWAKGNKPYVDENGSQFAKRLCDEKYGAGNYSTKSQSEYAKIKKWGDRAFE